MLQFVANYLVLCRYVIGLTAYVRRHLFGTRAYLFLLYLHCLGLNSVLSPIRRQLHRQHGYHDGRLAQVSGRDAYQINPSNAAARHSEEVRDQAHAVNYVGDLYRDLLYATRVKAINGRLGQCAGGRIFKRLLPFGLTTPGILEGVGRRRKGNVLRLVSLLFRVRRQYASVVVNDFNLHRPYFNRRANYFRDANNDRALHPNDLNNYECFGLNIRRRRDVVVINGNQRRLNLRHLFVLPALHGGHLYATLNINSASRRVGLPTYEGKRYMHLHDFHAVGAARHTL